MGGSSTGKGRILTSLSLPPRLISTQSTRLLNLRIALTLFGYLSDAPDELVEKRRELFDEVHHSTIHYGAAREIADLVPEAALRMSPDEVAAECAADWKRPLGL